MSAVKKNTYDYIKRLFVPGLHSKYDLMKIAEHSVKANFINGKTTVTVDDDWNVRIEIKGHTWLFSGFLTTLEIMEESIAERRQIPEETS